LSETFRPPPRHNNRLATPALRAHFPAQPATMFRRPLLLLSALLAVAPLSAQTAGASGIKFKGVLVQGDEVKVCLVNLATNNAKWVPVGGKTAGYIVKSCATKVAYPYVVLIPSSGRGPETILRLEEVAAPASTLPVTPVASIAVPTPAPTPAVAPPPAPEPRPMNPEATTRQVETLDIIR
jgi:hypothetical protein